MRLGDPKLFFGGFLGLKGGSFVRFPSRSGFAKPGPSGAEVLSVLGLYGFVRSFLAASSAGLHEAPSVFGALGLRLMI